MSKRNSRNVRIKKKKHVLLEMQGGLCHYCLRKTTDEEVTYDHIIPKSVGGTATIGNGVAACLDCNQSRGIIPFEIFMLYLNNVINFTQEEAFKFNTHSNHLANVRDRRWYNISVSVKSYYDDLLSNHLH